jgi:molybdopterin molybdotransferase
MAQLSDDCFAGDDALVPVQAALERILPRLSRVTDAEALPLVECLDRILAEDVVAAIDVPGADNSAVDGYAVHFADLDATEETRLPIGGRAAAGHPLGRAQRRGEAVRIFTGAPMPAG